MDDFEKNEMSFDDASQETETLNDAVTEATDNIESEAPAADFSEETNGTELTENAEEDITEPQAEPAKKPVINKAIKIAICIFIVAGLIFGGAMLAKNLFSTSVVGTWVIDAGATDDEAAQQAATQYFTFNDDGTASLSSGTIKVFGTWNYTDKDNKKSETPTDSIYTSIYVYFVGNYNVKLEGNAFSGRTMKLSGDGGVEYKFKSVSEPKVEIEPSKDFKAVDGVTGKWTADITGAKMTYDLKDNGLIEYTVDDSTTKKRILLLTGKYTVNAEKKEIHVVYYSDEKKTETTMDLPYTVNNKTKGKKLTLSGQEFSIAK